MMMNGDTTIFTQHLASVNVLIKYHGTV